MQETLVWFLGWKMHWRRDRLPTPVFLDFPAGSAGEESVCNVGDLDSIPGLGRSPGEGKGYPLQYSGLENSMDCIVHGITKSRTQLRDFHNGYRISVWDDEKVLEMDSGEGRTTLWMYLMPLNYTIRNEKTAVMLRIFYHNLNKGKENVLYPVWDVLRDSPPVLYNTSYFRILFLTP